jgi:hypothetical protein
MTAEPIQTPVPPPLPLPVQDLAAVQQCRACAKFDQVQKAAAALADVDAVPASVYFRVGQLMTPARVDHVRRFHPALHEYNRQAEAARRAALGLQT